MYEIFWILKIGLPKNQNSGFWIPTETKQALSLAVLFCTLSVKVRILSETDLLAGEGAVYLRIEKNPLVCPTSKHRSKISRLTRATVPLCIGGTDSKVFSIYMRRFSY